jgi:hypothetical protein
MSRPSIGRTVHVLMDPQENGGADVAAATITQVHQFQDTDRSGLPRYCVNVRVIPNTSARIPELRTSVYLHERRPTDEELEADFPTPEARRLVAFWPQMVA